MLGDWCRNPPCDADRAWPSTTARAACRKVRPFLLARYGVEDVLQAQQDRGKAFIALTQPRDTGADTFEYRLALDVEGKAVLEAALGPLSAPKPRRRRARPQDLRPAPGRGARAPWCAGPLPPGTRSARPTRPPCCSPWTGSRSGTGCRRGAPRSGAPTPAPTSPPRRCGGCAATPRSSRSSSAAAGEVLDWGLEKRFFTAGPDQTALAPRRRLHLPRLRRPTAVDGRPPPRPLGRPRALRPGQRRPALRPAPHDRAHPPLRRPRRQGRARGTGRMGPHPRLLRRPARPAGASPSEPA